MKNTYVIILVFSTMAGAIAAANLAQPRQCYCTHSVKTISMVSTILSAGTATSCTHQGTARFGIIINNPGGQTNITSIVFLDPDNVSISAFQCSSQISCDSPATLTLSAGSNTSFNTQSTSFFPSSSITRGETCEFAFYFANGQGISGSLEAE